MYKEENTNHPFNHPIYQLLYQIKPLVNTNINQSHGSNLMHFGILKRGDLSDFECYIADFRNCWSRGVLDFQHYARCLIL